MPPRPVAWRALTALALALVAARTHAATYYVRQTVGKDSQDGRSPATAWEHVSLLSTALHAGDTAIVGPGLYREQVSIENDGTPAQRIVLLADPTGQRTGDPPGVVLLAGSDPVDETTFNPTGPPGVYSSSFLPAVVWGVVELDGPQARYARAVNPGEPIPENVDPLAIVAKTPSCFHYDEHSHVLTLHTSDGRPPADHELELIHRGDGVYVMGHHYVTVVGFTFRSMQDAGISFFKGSSDCTALDNVSWGSRQGIRVYGAQDTLLAGNTLFRNENAGAYFAAGSTNGVAIDNVAFENVKGLRWSSQSSYGVATGNVLFDNSERGLSLENVDGAVLRRNILVHDAVSELLVLQATYTADDNCFTTRNADALVADFSPFPFSDRFATLAAYQHARHEDLLSRDGGCAPLPVKPDVRRLHADSVAYIEWARAILSGKVVPPPASAAAPPPPARGWLDWLLRR